MEDEIKILFGCPIRRDVDTTQGSVDIDVLHSFQCMQNCYIIISFDIYIITDIAK